MLIENLPRKDPCLENSQPKYHPYGQHHIPVPSASYVPHPPPPRVITNCMKLSVKSLFLKYVCLAIILEFRQVHLPTMLAILQMPNQWKQLALELCLQDNRSDFLCLLYLIMTVRFSDTIMSFLLPAAQLDLSSQTFCYCV